MRLRRVTTALTIERADFRVLMPQTIGVSPLDGLLVLMGLPTLLVSG